jgi:thiamine pyrophosphokinase
MKKKKALLALNGKLPARDLIYRLQTPDLITICADGAWDQLTALGLKADIIAGDFDSIQKIPQSVKAISMPEQNASDLEKILHWLKKEGILQLNIIGISGGRTDHFLINITLLIAFAHEMEISVYDNDFTAWLLTAGTLSIPCQPGQIFSLLPWKSCSGVTLENAKFPLKNENVAPGSRGLSNVCLGSQLHCQMENGGLGLILTNSFTR